MPKKKKKKSEQSKLHCGLKWSAKVDTVNMIEIIVVFFGYVTTQYNNNHDNK